MKAKPKASTQQFLKISEIKDGVVVLKDGSFRAAVLVSSINFALKSEEERDAIIASFQGFLNALNFPLQIVIRSKKLELDAYIEKLGTIEKSHPNALIAEQAADYALFISRMLEVVNVMDKDFFVVVPFYPSGLKKLGAAQKLLSRGAPQAAEGGSSTDFETNKVQLMQRVDQVVNLLSSLGVRAATLNTEELIELYYSIYNPQLSRRQKLSDVSELAAPIVTGEPKDEKEAPGTAASATENPNG